MERSKPTPTPVQNKHMTAMGWNFQEKHPSSMCTHSHGMPPLMSFLICLALPLWLARLLVSFLGWRYCSPWQSSCGYEWLSQDIRAWAQKLTPGEPEGIELKTGPSTAAEWSRSRCSRKLKRPILEKSWEHLIGIDFTGQGAEGRELQLCTAQEQQGSRAALRTHLLAHLLNSILCVPWVCLGNGRLSL